MQVLIGEGSSFADGAAIDRNPVIKRAGRKIQELFKQVLAHVHRRNGVAPDGVLQASVEGDGVRPEVQDRGHAPVEKSVVGVAVLNDVDARE